MSIQEINRLMAEARAMQYGPERSAFVEKQVFPLLDELLKAGFNAEFNQTTKLYEQVRVEGGWRWIRVGAQWRALLDRV